MGSLYRWVQGRAVIVDIRFNHPELYTVLVADDMCRCGHTREEHRHYRVGNDCGRTHCPCGCFRNVVGLIRRLIGAA